MGPIQIFLLGFEDFRATSGIADQLTALSDAGTIRIIDARFLLKESTAEVVAVRVSDLDDNERDDLRAAAGTLVDLGAGAVLGGEDGAATGMTLGADAALDVWDFDCLAGDSAAPGLESRLELQRATRRWHE